MHLDDLAARVARGPAAHDVAERLASIAARVSQAEVAQPKPELAVMHRTQAAAEQG